MKLTRILRPDNALGSPVTRRALAASAWAVALISTAHAAEPIRIGMAVGLSGANSVVAQLETMGIAPNRLVAKGYGDHNPVADNSTEEGRALNRRISVLVTAK